MSPLLTVTAPPVKVPAENSVPPVLAIVAEAPEPMQTKTPSMVPEPVIEKLAADDRLIEPPDALAMLIVARDPE